MTTGCSDNSRLHSITFALMLGGLLLGSSAAAAAEAAGRDAAASDFPRELVLRPEVAPYEVETANRSLNQTNGPFLKEPDLSQQHVFRRMLPFGKDTNNAFALIWDQPKRRLYLDLNRNLDLTDDASGARSSTDRGYSQLFTNVTLPLKTDMGLHPATLDLRLSADATASWVQVQMTSRTLWQAKVVIEGETWQVAVADKLLSTESLAAAKFLLLRPWEVRTNRMYLDYPPYGAVPFPDRLFWLGRAFHLERRFETSGETPVWKLELTPQQPPLTELNLSGESLCYALLQATNGYTVLLHEAPGRVKVPQGVYTISTVWLKRGSSEAFRLSRKPWVVAVPGVTNLVLGGPLTNWVALERYGRRLVIERLLKGADGEPYNLTQRDPERLPEFAVYHGGKKVLAGKFRYG